MREKYHCILNKTQHFFLFKDKTPYHPSTKAQTTLIQKLSVDILFFFVRCHMTNKCIQFVC